MNFVYAVFICEAAFGCRPYGVADRYAAEPPIYRTLEACREAKPPVMRGVEFACFKRPTWTDAEGDSPSCPKGASCHMGEDDAK